MSESKSGPVEGGCTGCTFTHRFLGEKIPERFSLDVTLVLTGVKIQNKSVWQNTTPNS